MGMIFNDLNVVFQHNERCGGVALRKHLLNYESNFQRLTDTKHLTVADTKLYVGELWNKYLTVGFVRNPYDRLVSWYHACKQNPQWESDLALHVQNCDSFEELILNPHKKMLISQYDKVVGCKFLGRFENYKEDVSKLCELINVPYLDFIDNASNHKEYRDYYTDKTKSIVSKYFEKDLKEFSYEF